MKQKTLNQSGEIELEPNNRFICEKCKKKVNVINKIFSKRLCIDCMNNFFENLKGGKNE